MGMVSFDGINRQVNLAMVPEVKINDYVLVHVGVAIQTLDEEEAMKTMEYLKELNELNEELGPDMDPDPDQAIADQDNESLDQGEEK